MVAINGPGKVDNASLVSSSSPKQNIAKPGENFMDVLSQLFDNLGERMQDTEIPGVKRLGPEPQVFDKIV